MKVQLALSFFTMMLLFNETNCFISCDKEKECVKFDTYSNKITS